MARTVEDAEKWGRANLEPVDEPTWHNMCGSLVYRAAGFDGPSANSAREIGDGSGIASADSSAAPRGSFHHWYLPDTGPDQTGDGHIGLDLDGGGTRVMMATNILEDAWTEYLGTASVDYYNTQNPTSKIYRGWSLDFMGQTLADAGTSPEPPVPPISPADGQTLQNLAALGGYTGPIDGDPGVETWKGVQTVLRAYGYGGPIDGVPGTELYLALQRLAADGGYTGPIDGEPGPDTYAGVAAWVAAQTPPPGGGPTMGVYGIDVGTTQQRLSFPAAKAAGFQWVLVKAGGSNVPIYVAPYYQAEVDAARSAGLLVGHYWVAGTGTPAADATFFLEHLHDYRPGDLVALDNEGIDSGIVWNDSQVSAFVTAVKSALGVAPFHYTTRSILASSPWTSTQTAGSKLWIADPDHAAGSPSIGTYPEWSIHQYTISNLGNIPVDQNIAKLSTFEGFAQPPFGETVPPSGYVPPEEPPTSVPNADGKLLQQLAQRGGYNGPVDGEPGPNTWLGVQTVLHDEGYYDGPIDGEPGTNTYKGLQLLAADYGYTGPIDGAPGPNTYIGIQAYLNAIAGGVPPVSTPQGETLQRLSKAGGYTGPIDGDPGANTWRGIQHVVSGYGYTGPTDGLPGTNTYAAMQRLAQLGGYTGPIDGELGVNTWKALQTILAGFGYTGPIDGVPGTNSWAALQRLARLGGYVGPADGDLSILSWVGVQKVLSGNGYSGPIDGSPGTNTYKGLQMLARRGGYMGPVDGIPGANTYAALANLA